jgi:hypothetical protein
MGIVSLYGLAVLGLAVLGLAVLGLAALVTVVDVRTGRGYALGILSSRHLAITTIVVGSFTILAQVQPKQKLGITLLLMLYFALSVYVIATALIGAAIVAGKAGHWWWIVGFFVAAAVPTLVVAVPFPYRYMDLNTGYFVQNIGFLGMLIAPDATVLAYSITRLRHPVAPARARQTAPLS